MKTHNAMSNIHLGYCQPAPAIGMGATICGYTDRHASTVVGIEYFKSGSRLGRVKAVIVQEDHSIRTDTNGVSESQTYVYTPNPTAISRRFPGARDGTYGSKAAGFLILGRRDKWHDYSF
jgi:hypothetical protein